MVSAPRCPPGPRGLLALLLLLPLPGARGTCDSPPRLSFAELPGAVNNSYPVDTKLKYSCRPGYILGSGKSPFVICLANSTWSVDPEFCVGRPCKTLELENGRVYVTDIRFGARATFSCNEGYRLIGTTSARCVVAENGVDWDKELPLCQAIPCLPPPDITHGSHTGQSEQEFSFGSAVTYKCEQSFSLIGEASIHCTTKDNNGEWSGPAPECKVVRCPEPEVKNGKKQSGYGLDYSYGNTIIFECDFGYTLTGSSSVKCEANNSWVPSLPACLPIACLPPPDITHGSHTGQSEQEFSFGSAVTYKCDQGFSLIGKASIHCTTKDNVNGEWSGPAPECKGTCDSPPRLSFAELPGAVNNSYPVDTKLKYSCRPGYILGSGKSPFVICLANSTWSVDPEFCVGRPCKTLELENGRVYVTDIRFGARATFSCNEGYRLIGTTSARCVVAENGVDWDKELPLCQAIPCLPPPDITHGSHTGQSEQEFSFGSAVTYKCEQSFSLIGEASIHCTTKDNNGEWSGPAPECKVVRCPEPEVKNGKKQSGYGLDYSYGNTIIFECDFGYTLTGSSSVKCEANNSWVPSLPACLPIACLPPPDITHGSHTGQSEQEFSFGSAVTYKCDQGFSLIGKASIHCTTKDNVNGEWSGPAPECKGTCDSPPRLSFAELPGAVNNSYPVDTKLKYSCRPGYILGSGKSPFVICLANSTWSVDPEFCVGRPCKTLELENGRVYLTDIQFGATATFSCNEGYRLIGTTSAQCVVAGNGVDWDKELPLCQAIPCLPPPDITHGSHTGQSEQEFSFGSAVTYKCEQGFSLIGEASIHCTTKDNNGEWSGPAPACKVVRCPEPEVKNGKKQSWYGLDYSYGNTVIFECDFGYTLTGSSSVKCEANNSWVPSLPACLPIACLPPPDITHGSYNALSGEKFSFGSAVTYKCDKGFSLIGEASIHCTTKDNVNGEWSGPAPECKESTAKPTEKTTKNTPESTAKPTEKTTKNTPGSNTGTMIAIGAVIGLLVAGGIVAIVTYKACFGKKGKDACHSGSADY